MGGRGLRAARAEATVAVRPAAPLRRKAPPVGSGPAARLRSVAGQGTEYRAQVGLDMTHRARPRQHRQWASIVERRLRSCSGQQNACKDEDANSSRDRLGERRPKGSRRSDVPWRERSASQVATVAPEPARSGDATRPREQVDGGDPVTLGVEAGSGERPETMPPPDDPPAVLELRGSGEQRRAHAVGPALTLPRWPSR